MVCLGVSGTQLIRIRGQTTTEPPGSLAHPTPPHTHGDNRAFTNQPTYRPPSVLHQTATRPPTQLFACKLGGRATNDGSQPAMALRCQRFPSPRMQGQSRTPPASPRPSPLGRCLCQWPCSRGAASQCHHWYSLFQCMHEGDLGRAERRAHTQAMSGTGKQGNHPPGTGRGFRSRPDVDEDTGTSTS